METLPMENIIIPDDYYYQSFATKPHPYVAPTTLDVSLATHSKTGGNLEDLFDSSFSTFFDPSSPSNHHFYPIDFGNTYGIVPDGMQTHGSSIYSTTPPALEHDSLSPTNFSYFEGSCSPPDCTPFPGRSISQNYDGQLNHISHAPFNTDFTRRSSRASEWSGTTCSVDEEQEPLKPLNKSRDVRVGSLLVSAEKPRCKRGRKRSNLTDEERRLRRLERGRVAANKCRKKKREMESELEIQASELLVERDRMLKLNNDLKDQIRLLQAEVLKHVGSDCGVVVDVGEKREP